MRSTFSLVTEKNGWYNIDPQVRQAVAESGVKDGLCLIYLPHTTAGLAATSSWDPKGIDDALTDLRAKFPARTSYQSQDAPFAGAARSKSALSGCSRTFVVKDGALLLGHSQTLVFFEFDGPRERQFSVTVISKEFYFESIPFPTDFGQMRDVTEEVHQAVGRSGVKNGLCHLTVVAATAGIVVCAQGEALHRDLWEDIDRLIPARADFRHRETASDAAGHIKTFVAGTQLDLPVQDGVLLLNKEQRIVYTEFDGPRPRDVKVAVYGN